VGAYSLRLLVFAFAILAKRVMVTLGISRVVAPRLAYGCGPDDPMPFIVTLTPQYVARALGKTPPVTFHEIEKYAYDNAGDLRAMALLEKGSGRLNLILE
jgi:hypothetical protein